MEVADASGPRKRLFCILKQIVVVGGEEIRHQAAVSKRGQVPVHHRRTIGIVLGAAKAAHILTSSATVRRIVNMTAFAAVDVTRRSGR